MIQIINTFIDVAFVMY